MDAALAVLAPPAGTGLREGDLEKMQAAFNGGAMDPAERESALLAALGPLVAMGGWLMEHLEEEATTAAAEFDSPWAPLPEAPVPVKMLPSVDTLPSLLRGGNGVVAAAVKPDLLLLARSVKASSLDAKGRGNSGSSSSSSSTTHTSAFGVGGEPLVCKTPP
jgi:hypothetical protein